MFAKILKRLRDAIRSGQYVMTVHADEEMDNDNLSLLDAEQGTLSGEIVERQKDAETSEWKYLIKGTTTAEEAIAVVVKFGPTGKVVILTVFAI